MCPLFSLERSSTYAAQEQQDRGHALQLFAASSSEEAQQDGPQAALPWHLLCPGAGCNNTHTFPQERACRF